MNVIFGEHKMEDRISIEGLSSPVENSPLYRSKIPQPPRGGGLQDRLADARWYPAGEAEAGNAGVQPAKE